MKQKKQDLVEKATRLHKEVYKFAYSRTKDCEIAQDIAQTVMEAAICKIDSLRNPQALKQWIMQITANEINGYFRKLKNSRARMVDNNEDIEAIEQIIDIEADILKILTKKESYKTVIKALLSLDKKYSEVIKQHIIYELPFREISEKFNINYSTAKTRYVRGIRLLKEAFIEMEKKGELDE